MKYFDQNIGERARPLRHDAHDFVDFLQPRPPSLIALISMSCVGFSFRFGAVCVVPRARPATYRREPIFFSARGQGGVLPSAVKCRRPLQEDS